MIDDIPPPLGGILALLWLVVYVITVRLSYRLIVGKRAAELYQTVWSVRFNRILQYLCGDRESADF